MAFQTVPSGFLALSWGVTYHDVQTRLRLFLSEKQLLFNQDFQVLAQVVSMAFGGKQESAIEPPKTAAQAMAQFKSLNL